MLLAGAPAVWAMVPGAKNGGGVTAQLRREPSDEKLAAHLTNMIARSSILGLAGMLLLALSLPAAERPATPDFKEVETVLREHLAGAPDESLNRAAVDGLLLALKGRVLLETNASATAVAPAATGPCVARQRIFDGGVAYVQVKRVADALPGEIAAAVKRLSATNKLTGFVLDLRYADGTDYTAAAHTVDLFLSKEVPLLNAGQGLLRSEAKTNAIQLPVVALLNEETGGAAEAVGAMLRQTATGLLIGTRTAGHAGVMNEFKLSTGQTLRLLTASVQLGDAKAIPTTGVAPDIEVKVNPDDERRFYADPFAGTLAPEDSSTNTVANPPKRVRLTEADLVREHRTDGDAEEDVAPLGRTGPDGPVIQDPALARGIDLLKGLAVVRQGHF